ncbi:MAG: radical SAM protein [Endomicrobiaceae bacterium]|nr:radical SAM protein [Endomicrobiaceae bacterium]
MEKGYKNPYDYERDLQKLVNKIIIDIQEKNIESDTKRVIEIFNDVKNIKVPSGIQKRFDNILLNEYEIAERKTVLKSKIRRLYCAVTSFCNIKCIMCDIEKHKWELPERAIEEIIELMPYLENVMWQGGEVFFYKHFEKLMDSANLNKVNQEIVTNGLLLNEKNIHKLVEYNVDLGISIDGLTKDVYEYIRVGANFDKLIDNIKLLKKIKLNNRLRKSHLRLNVLVMKSNIEQIEFFPEFAAEYGFTRLCVNPFGPDFVSQENIFHYNKSDKFKYKIMNIKEKLFEKCKYMNIELVDSLPSYRIMNEIPSDKKEESVKKEDTKGEVENVTKTLLLCHAPWRKIFIDSDGTIMPECLCKREYSIGNISKNKIDEIWNNDNMQAYRQKIINGDQYVICKSDCTEGRIPSKVLKDVINTNLFWWEF